MAATAAQAVLTALDGVYVDATFGRGGHSRELLARLSPAARLIAFDRDPQAEAQANTISDPRFRFVRTQFSRMTATLADMDITQVQGILLDIGVSSPQIDDPQRGFSFRANGPLDMRMDPEHGESAAQWLARASIDELTRVIRDHGEERFAASIAKAVVARREAGRPLSTTADLAALVADTIPKSRKDATQHPATRTFQAVRIHINQELEELALALEQAVHLLAPGGRLGVISFHSLEDPRSSASSTPMRTRSATLMRAWRACRCAPTSCRSRRCGALGKQVAGDDEIAANPRARSASCAWPSAPTCRSRPGRAADARAARHRGGAAGGQQPVPRDGPASGAHLFVDLERAQLLAKQLEAEGDRLRVDLGRASQPAVIESAARELGLKPVDGSRVVFLPAAAGAVPAARGTP
jgi:16S rRNA (cytosine1402-N4)-methyltransferase